ncbi:MAG: 2-C-methyl-D-erythritol 4-phosphate cytidylyltransferase [Caldiserica bacterium]|nr:2-C-methyl-D-erythritol 4-phosphate cytidylyltransferase [Caldisericota bacterium]
MRIGAIIAAGGTSHRFGTDKLAIVLNGKSVLAWSQNAILKHQKVEKVVTVCSDVEYYSKIGMKSQSMSYIPGGSVREESVNNGLKMLEGFDVILVHDGARPFLSQRIIDDLIESADQAACVIPVIPCTSALKSVQSGFVTQHVNQKYMLAQTPQLVWSEPLRLTFERFGDKLGDFPDESSMIAELGLHVKTVPGSSANIKITNPDDEVIARALSMELLRTQK